MPVAVDEIEVGGGSGSQGIGHFHQALIVQEDVFGVEAFVFNFIFLQSAHAQNETCEDGPELFFLELPFLECPFVDFGAEVPLGVFPHGVNFINIGTEMVDGFALHSYALWE